VDFDAPLFETQPTELLGDFTLWTISHLNAISALCHGFVNRVD